MVQGFGFNGLCFFSVLLVNGLGHKVFFVFFRV